MTQPLAPVIIDALHKAVDEMGVKETFHGYAPDLGYEFLRNAISKNDYADRGCDIAADEILSNIVRYSGATAVQVDCEMMDGRTVIRFMDDGDPYDPTAQPDPDITLSAEDREIGGLGIFIVKNIMDRVSYEYTDGRNILTIEKSW